MKRNYIYMLMALLALVFSCQKPELVEDESGADANTGEMVTGKVPITFSAMLPSTPGTKAINDEIQSMHLVVFDKEHMLVEVCEAEILGEENHTGHIGERKFSVTLTVTDEKRYIHFIANCPVDQIIYGHEVSIIGNLNVQNNIAAYWARIEVDNILVEKFIDSDNKAYYKPAESIRDKFICVPMLRNYAQITVLDNTDDDDNFVYQGFTIYNTVEKGTVAPYNNKTQTFQSFLDEYGQKYSYPDLMKLTFPYEGHALASAELNNRLIMKDGTYGEFGQYGKGDNVKFYGANNEEKVFTMYERKVSVKTDEEDKWKESPPHIIIKGTYLGKTYFYKVDLVYDVMDDNGTPDDKTDDIVKEVKYYNILRNFSYNFTIIKVAGPGFETIEEAMNGADGNNLSGSSTTAKLTNISNNIGRLWVSYTDTTLVNSNNITLKYKYMPNISDESKTDTYGKVVNDLAQLENTVGEVISEVVSSRDITDDDDPWYEYREVTLKINEPGNMTKEQVLVVKTNNANLARDVRYYLKKKFIMDVVCTKKVEKKIGAEVEVDVHLPLGLTDDMFPLKLEYEVEDMTLSPNAGKNIIPVTLGTSLIPGKEGKRTYRYTLTIETLEDYKNLKTIGNQKCFKTYWVTSAADNASSMYVLNKYFDIAHDNWENYLYAFSNVKCSSSALGVGEDVEISFTMADGAINREVTISLVGMSYTGTLNGVNYTDATEIKYTPTQRNVTIPGFKTTTASDPVSFTLDASEYDFGTAEADRQTYQFNGKFVGVTNNSIEAEADIEVKFEFNIEEAAFNALKALYPDAGADGVPMYVTLDRLYPADDQLVHSQIRAEGDRYIYRIKQAGKQEILLATTDAEGGACSVTLQADYFTDQTVTINQKLMQFQSLTLPTRVAQGTGKSVNITFKLNEGDSNRDVKVVLENMARNGATTLEFNTGNNSYVTNNNGTYTITNVVTTGANNATLKVTISAAGYESKSATCSTRTRGTFSNTGYSYDGSSVTTLSNAAGDLVDFNFEISDYTPGMTINVELDGLEPADGALTKAITYKYVPTSAGMQTIHLKTSGTGTNQCTIKLTADDFDASSTVSITRSAPQIDKNKLVIKRTGNSNFNSTTNKNKVSLYTEDPEKNTSATAIKSDITFARNSSNKKQASNNSAISLDKVPLSSIIYIKCTVDGAGPYYTSCLLRDAVNGTTVNIQ